MVARWRQPRRFLSLSCFWHFHTLGFIIRCAEMALAYIRIPFTYSIDSLKNFFFFFFFLKSGKRSKTLHIWVCYSCGWRQSFILFHSGWRVERKQQQPPKKRKKTKRRDAVCVAQVNSFLIFIFYFIFFLKGTSSIDLIFVRGWCVGEESL